MINPLRSEAEAYRWLLLTVGALRRDCVAALYRQVGRNQLCSSALTLGRCRLRGAGERTEPPRQAVPSSRGRANERRILVIANETVGGERLRDGIQSRSEGCTRTFSSSLRR